MANLPSVSSISIGDGARQLEHAVVGARREVQLAHGLNLLGSGDPLAHGAGGLALPLGREVVFSESVALKIAYCTFF